MRSVPKTSTLVARQGATCRGQFLRYVLRRSWLWFDSPELTTLAIQPNLVKALVSVAMLMATFVLAADEQIGFDRNVAPWAIPFRDMVITVVFTLVASPIAEFVDRRKSTFQ